ncbi:MAG: methionine adenosyltransferase [Desulfatibacillaceae bacterium]
MRKDFVFISESVTEGHPDKLCDQISDAVVDKLLVQDPYARMRAECAVASAIVFIAVRYASSAVVDFSQVARKVIDEAGYDQPDFNSKTCSILTTPTEQEYDPAWRFEEEKLTEEQIEAIPPKNQATVFGFACNQSRALLPMPIFLANKLTRRLSDVRREKVLPYIAPDGKVQVAVEYKNRKPERVYAITVEASQRGDMDVSPKTLHDDLLETVVRPVFVDEDIRVDDRTRIFINPDGAVIDGGPSSHSGLTGRKNAVDTYGEYSRHSGKALSGKGPSRIDRVGVYAARYAAKNVVASGLADTCEITLSYSLGVSRPVSLHVDTYGTGKLKDSRISALVQEHFDFRLAAIVRNLSLRHLPSMNSGRFYQHLAARGHLGRADMDLPWERTDKAELFAEAGK